MIGEIDVDGPKLTRLERSASTLQRVKKAKNEEILGAATVLGLTSLAMGIAGLVFSLTNHEYFDGPHSLNDAAVEACEQVKACTLANGYDGCVNGTLPADYDGCELKFCAQDVFLAAFIMGCICGSIGVGVIACIVYIVVKGDQVGLQPS